MGDEIFGEQPIDWMLTEEAPPGATIPSRKGPLERNNEGSLNQPKARSSSGNID